MFGLKRRHAKRRSCTGASAGLSPPHPPTPKLLALICCLVLHVLMLCALDVCARGKGIVCVLCAPYGVRRLVVALGAAAASCATSADDMGAAAALLCSCSELLQKVAARPSALSVQSVMIFIIIIIIQ